MKLTHENLRTLHSKYVTNAFGSSDAYRVAHCRPATKEAHLAAGRSMLKCIEGEGLIERCGHMHYRLTDRGRSSLGLDNDHVANTP